MRDRSMVARVGRRFLSVGRRGSVTMASGASEAPIDKMFGALTKAACTARGSLRRAFAKGWPTTPVGLAHPPRKESFKWPRSLAGSAPGLFF
jgi:hypothetical protein